MDDEEAQPADNHLALPHPLGQLTLPRLVDMDLDYAVFVKHRTKRAARKTPPRAQEDAGRSCNLLGCLLLRRMRVRKPIAKPVATHGSNSSGAATSTVAIHLDVSKAAESKLASGEPSVSPVRKGQARSPFVDGLRSISRDRPGRLVRSLAGRESRSTPSAHERPGSSKAKASGSAVVAFSVHA